MFSPCKNAFSSGCAEKTLYPKGERNTFFCKNVFPGGKNIPFRNPPRNRVLEKQPSSTAMISLLFLSVPYSSLSLSFSARMGYIARSIRGKRRLYFNALWGNVFFLYFSRQWDI